MQTIIELVIHLIRLAQAGVQVHVHAIQVVHHLAHVHHHHSVNPGGPARFPVNPGGPMAPAPNPGGPNA
jgi:hypothetical protein